VDKPDLVATLTGQLEQLRASRAKAMATLDEQIAKLEAGRGGAIPQQDMVLRSIPNHELDALRVSGRKTDRTKAIYWSLPRSASSAVVVAPEAGNKAPN
jgi:hypothetical protein